MENIGSLNDFLTVYDKYNSKKVYSAFEFYQNSTDYSTKLPNQLSPVPKPSKFKYQPTKKSRIKSFNTNKESSLADNDHSRYWKNSLPDMKNSDSLRAKSCSPNTSMIKPKTIQLHSWRENSIQKEPKTISVQDKIRNDLL